MQLEPRFQGIFTAIVTPFTADESVDTASLKQLVELQIAAGVHGIVACGSTGETAVLEDHDQIIVVETCVKQANGRIPVIAGASSNNTKRACTLQRQMTELGVSATIQTTPWYNRPTQEGLHRHFQAIADSSKMPILLYNVPSRTGIDIAPETIIRLAKNCPSIIGIKDANVDVLRIQTYLRKLRDIRPDFAILSGEDFFVLPLLAMGGHGLISVGSNVVPTEFVALFDAFRNSDLKKAQDLANRIAALTDLMFFRTNPIPVKTSLSLLGLITEQFRLPLCELSANDKRFLQQGLQDLRIL